MGRASAVEGVKSNGRQPAGNGSETSRRPLLSAVGLYLFAAALLADLVFIAAGPPEWRLVSKPLIVSGLLVHGAANGLAGKATHRWILPALFFSLLGDVLLLFEDRSALYFILGLSAFLVAHLFYCLFFVGIWKHNRLRVHLPFVMGVLAYYVGLVVLLWPGLGGMKVPVLVYGFVISAMLLLALHTVLLPKGSAARLLMPGAILFVLSDSILAVARFLHPFVFSGLAVMLTYGFAQLLLTRGALAYRVKKPFAGGVAAKQ